MALAMIIKCCMIKNYCVGFHIIIYFVTAISVPTSLSSFLDVGKLQLLLLCFPLTRRCRWRSCSKNYLGGHYIQWKTIDADSFSSNHSCLHLYSGCFQFLQEILCV